MTDCNIIRIDEAETSFCYSSAVLVRCAFVVGCVVTAIGQNCYFIRLSILPQLDTHTHNHTYTHTLSAPYSTHPNNWEIGKVERWLHYLNLHIISASSIANRPNNIRTPGGTDIMLGSGEQYYSETRAAFHLFGNVNRHWKGLLTSYALYWINAIVRQQIIII